MDKKGDVKMAYRDTGKCTACSAKLRDIDDKISAVYDKHEQDILENSDIQKTGIDVHGDSYEIKYFSRQALYPYLPESAKEEIANLQEECELADAGRTKEISDARATRNEIASEFNDMQIGDVKYGDFDVLTGLGEHKSANTVAMLDVEHLTNNIYKAGTPVLQEDLRGVLPPDKVFGAIVSQKKNGNKMLVWFNSHDRKR